MSFLDGVGGILNAALDFMYEDAELIGQGTVRVPDGEGGWTYDSIEAPCRALITDYSQADRASGIPASDRQVFILTGSTPIEPRNGWQVGTLDGRWWQIISVRRDPARAAWQCQVRETEAPEGAP